MYKKIDNPEQLFLIGKSDEYPLDGCYEIVCDLSFENITEPLEGIGSKERPFTGTIFGKDHILSELKLKSSLIKYAVNAKIIGLNLYISTIDLTDIGIKDVYSGILLGTAINTDLSDISINKSTIIGKSGLAFLCGQVRGGTHYQCFVSGSIIEQEKYTTPNIHYLYARGEPYSLLKSEIFNCIVNYKQSKKSKFINNIIDVEFF